MTKWQCFSYCPWHFKNVTGCEPCHSISNGFQKTWKCYKQISYNKKPQIIKQGFNLRNLQNGPWNIKTQICYPILHFLFWKRLVCDNLHVVLLYHLCSVLTTNWASYQFFSHTHLLISVRPTSFTTLILACQTVHATQLMQTGLELLNLC
jgi:hypothetical protein